MIERNFESHAHCIVLEVTSRGMNSTSMQIGDEGSCIYVNEGEKKGRSCWERWEKQRRAHGMNQRTTKYKIKWDTRLETPGRKPPEEGKRTFWGSRREEKSVHWKPIELGTPQWGSRRMTSHREGRRSGVDLA
jgi:hypothetical protein